MHISELLRQRIRLIAYILLLVSLSSSAQQATAPLEVDWRAGKLAATTEGLVVQTIAERRSTNSTNLTQLVAADELHIGDEILYTLRVQNRSAAVIESAVIVKAVPRNTVYVAGSAVGPATIVDFSVDGGYQFASPDDLAMTISPDNSRPALTSDYTHIRWQMRHPLAAGATALLRFRGEFR
jgi:uncharacterized repeat protein (TIGR01451 family)